MDPEHTVGVQMDIELDPAGAQFYGALEGGEGVLRALSGGTAVGDDFGTGHAVS